MLTPEQKKKIEEENLKIENNIRQINHRIVIFSGKGGVGKTMVSVNLACAFKVQGYTTGVLDADVTGPNVLRMIGKRNELMMHENKIIPQKCKGIHVVSMDNLLPPGQAVVWRGPMRSKLINQFLGDVQWGKLDFLVADLPPGTGDEIITITQGMRPNMAIIVTTPQEVSLMDSARAITMAKKIGVPRIAVIENMSGLVCPECGHRIELFGSGGGKKQAKEMNVSFLGSIPINPEARKLADEGKPIVLEKKETDISVMFFQIAEKIENMISIK